MAVLITAVVASLHLVLPISLAVAVAARDRRALVQPGRQGVRLERRLVRLRPGEPRHAAGARGRRRAADRLRADGRGLRRGRRLRDHLGRAVAGGAPARALARLRRDPDRRQPARRARVGPAVRVPDLRVHRDPLSDARDRRGEVHGRHVPGCDRAAPARGRNRRAGRLRPAEGVLVGRRRADGRRVDLERRDRLPPAAVPERSADALRDGRDRDQLLRHASRGWP